MDELPLIAILRAPNEVPEDKLLGFGDNEEKATKQAVLWAWLHRRDKTLDQRTAAQRVGVPSSHFSNIINGKKHLPPHKINGYEWCCGWRAVSQTIERFRKIREEQQAMVVARALVQAQERVKSA